MSAKSRNAKRTKKHSKPSPSRTLRLQSQQERAVALQHAGQLQNAGNLPAAAAIYKQLLSIEPANENALFALGLLEHQRGDQQTAGAHFERLIKLRDNAADYRLWYARILRAQGDTQRALDEVRKSRALDPLQAGVYQTESTLLRELGSLEEARDLLNAGIVLVPRSALLHANLGEICLALGDPSRARAAFERALELDATLCAAWSNLGLALQAQGHAEAAQMAFEQALRVEPDNAEAHYNFAVALQNRDLFEPAIAHAVRALELRPLRGDWMTGLAGLLSQICEFDEALHLYHKGLALRPDAQEHSSLVALQQYLPGPAAERLQEAQRWGALYGQLQPAPRVGARAPGPLRVGYVSADFRQHSVCYFFEPLLAAHDPGRVAVTCYLNSKKTDAVTERLAQRATMRTIVDLSDEEVIAMIQRDKIDVLVELSGHTLGHRLQVFAREPAPLQLAYLGYPGTTGVPTIRYRLTDPLVDPEPIADAFYSERLVRLPRVFCCFQPPAEAPALAPLPARARGQITFGSLNKYMKVADPVLSLWAKVMNAVPNSRLILQSNVFADPGVCEHARARFAKHGIAAERIELFGAMPLEQHLALYEQIDIGLDTCPWNGHTTTCLALHMGVPVLALEGDAGASRMGVSVLSAAGLADWVAADEEAFVQAALRWSSDLGALGELRAGMRTQLQRSALCDKQSLAAEVEAAYAALLTRA